MVAQTLLNPARQMAAAPVVSHKIDPPLPSPSPPAASAKPEAISQPPTAESEPPIEAAPPAADPPPPAVVERKMVLVFDYYHLDHIFRGQSLRGVGIDRSRACQRVPRAARTHAGDAAAHAHLLEFDTVHGRWGASVSAGADRTAQPGDNVTITGSGNDPDGSIVSWAWSQQSGPAAALSGEAAHGLSGNELPEAEESDAAATDQKETADVRPRGDLDSVAEVSNEIAPDADSAWSNNGVVDQTESRNDNVVPLAKNTVDE